MAADPPAAPGPDLPPGEEALAVETTVVEERGRFVVFLDVLLTSGAVRRRAGDYPDRARAEQAARIMVRNARRHLPPAPPDPAP